MSAKQAAVTWLTGMTFDAQMGRHHVMLDSAATPEESRGPGPMDLLLASVAACTAMDVVSILEKARQPLARLVVRAEGERAPDHPRRYTQVTLVYEIHGEGLSPEQVARAVQLSHDKYCSVSGSLKEPVEIRSRLLLNGADQPESG
jgi:putative redox protein